MIESAAYAYLKTRDGLRGVRWRGWGYRGARSSLRITRFRVRGFLRV